MPIAHAAGDADHGYGKVPAIVRRDLLQRRLHIFHQKDGPRLPLRDPLGQTAGRALCKGSGDIIMAVHLLALIGHKEITGPDQAAVDDHPAKLRIAVKSAAEPSAGGIFCAQ